MSNSITVSSETKLASRNGDGPAVLESAATLYAALSALGSVPIIEIIIRTQQEQQGVTANPTANPTTAAPPRSGRTSRHTAEWLTLSRAEREARIHAEGRRLTQQIGHVLRMDDWNELRSAEMPTADGVAVTYAPGRSWKLLAEQWVAADAANAESR